MLLLRNWFLAALYAGLAFEGCGSEPERILHARLFRNAQPPVEIASGDTITTGERLYMVVTVQRPLHLYVVNESAAGDRRVIHPCSTWRGGLRLKAGEHRLPRELYWRVPLATPRERLLVIASERPVPLLDSIIVKSRKPCVAVVTAEASRWIDGLAGSRNRNVWISTFELKGTAGHG